MSLAETALKATYNSFVRNNPQICDHIMDMLRKITADGGRRFSIDLRDHAVLNSSELIEWLRYEGFQVVRQGNNGVELLVSW